MCEALKSALFSRPPLCSQGIWSCIHGVHIDMKKKKPELNFSPQANMLHLLKSAKSVALSSPKRNTVLLQPSILDVMTGKGTVARLRHSGTRWQGGGSCLFCA